MFFANIFSQCVVCLSIPLVLSFAEKKFLVLMKSSLSMISFIDYVFGVVSKKASPYPWSFRFFPVLSSRSFMVLCFTSRSMICFELIFVLSVRTVSKFIFLLVNVQLFQ